MTNYFAFENESSIFHKEYHPNTRKCVTPIRMALNFKCSASCSMWSKGNVISRLMWSNFIVPWTTDYLVKSSVIVLIRLMLSLWVKPKVITLSGFCCKIDKQSQINVNILSMQKKNQLFLRLKSEPKVQTRETSFSFNFLIHFLSHKNNKSNNKNNNNNNNINKSNNNNNNINSSICHSIDNRFLRLEILIVSVCEWTTKSAFILRLTYWTIIVDWQFCDIATTLSSYHQK